MSAAPKLAVELPAPASTPAAPLPAASNSAARWIPLDVASERSGKHIDHLARLCRNEWSPRNLARKEVPSGGGKACWFVHVDADPAFIAHQAAADIEDPMLDVPANKRAVARHRKAIVIGWRKAMAQGYTHGQTEATITTEYLASIGDQKKISRRTLYLWDERLRTYGIRGLVDLRGAPSEEKPTTAFLARVRELWLDQRKRKVSVCYDLAMDDARKQGWPIPSQRTVYNYLKSIPQAIVTYNRLGPAAYTDDIEPYIERDYTTLRSNECWVGDHHPFDVMVQSIDRRTGELRHERPNITVWQDKRSRKIVGWVIYLHAPNTMTILASLEKGIKACGKPEMVEVDNGKDYGAKALHGTTKRQRRRGASVDQVRAEGVFNRLTIKSRFVQKYHGQSKVVERWFKTLETRFGQLWPTWCGSDVESKPEDLKAQLDAGRAPTLEEFVAAFAAYIENDYNARPHFGQGMGGKSPNEVFETCLTSVTVIPAEQLAMEMQERLGPLCAHQNGVTWKGINYGRGEKAIRDLIGKGKKIWLRVGDKVGEVTAWTEGDTFLCLARANEMLPPNADRESVKAALAEKRRIRRMDLEYRNTPARARLESLPQTMRRVAAENVLANPAPPQDPAPITPHRTGLEGQMPAVQRAFARKAAGGEGMSPREMPSLEDMGRIIDADSEASGGGDGDGPFTPDFSQPADGGEHLSILDRIGEFGGEEP